MNFTKTLSRNEMKNIMAGSIYAECDGCNNDTCKGYVDADDCESALYQLCGPGGATLEEHSDGPEGYCIE